MRVVVLTVDQHGSQTQPDQVPAALDALAPVPARLAFQRTAGDEFQGVLDDPAALPVALEHLLRTDVWNIGIGIGEIETPLPDQAREATAEHDVRRQAERIEAILSRAAALDPRS
jgi:hypothetical protein